MKLPRRDFLKTAALTGAALACTTNAAEPVPAVKSSATRKRVKLAIATYSYWHFRDPKVSIEQVIERTAALGVEGVDILHRQMELPEKEPLTAGHRAYLRRLKRLAFTAASRPSASPRIKTSSGPSPSLSQPTTSTRRSASTSATTSASPPCASTPVAGVRPGLLMI